MTVRDLRAIVFAILCLISFQAQAQAAKPEAPGPIALHGVTIGDRGTELLLRFDRPISHVRSRLALFRNGQVVDTIHFRLRSAPNVLFARIRTPAPGNYTVRWTVCPEGTDDSYEGEFPFTVGDVAASTADRPR